VKPSDRNEDGDVKHAKGKTSNDREGGEANLKEALRQESNPRRSRKGQRKYKINWASKRAVDKQKATENIQGNQNPVEPNVNNDREERETYPVRSQYQKHDGGGLQEPRQEHSTLRAYKPGGENNMGTYQNMTPESQHERENSGEEPRESAEPREGREGAQQTQAKRAHTLADERIENENDENTENNKEKEDLDAPGDQEGEDLEDRPENKEEHACPEDLDGWVAV
jgi:hypothetical protein